MQIRTICLFLLTFCFIQLSWAQSSNADLFFSPQAVKGWQSPATAIPLTQPEPFIAASLAWKGESQSFDIRFSTDGERWGEWIRLHLDSHGEQSPERYVSELYFADADSRYVQFRAQGPVEQLQAHFYDPGKTKEKTERSSEAPLAFRGPEYCPCPQPAYEDRADWCPDGSCPPNSSPDFTNVTHLIVHHSAGTNTASDWAAVVRSIWDFHVITRGWSDIGYNWLIAPTGVVYEGRGDGILGAHFCGTNGNTMGVCMMGDYTNITPTEAALDALKELLAWKACDADIDPLGKAFHPSSNLTLDNISGHRDGCATACPGDAFYPMLSDVRQSVAGHIASSCAPIGAPQQLSATALSETEALLEWTDISDNETAFLVERSQTFNGGYEEIASAGENVTTYEDTGLQPQTGYYYRVRSVNEQDTSIYSNKAFVFTQVVGLDGPLGAEHVRLFPNPTRNQLRVTLDSELSGTVYLRLFDATGRQAWNTEMQGGQWTREVPMEHLPTGLYLLQLQHDEVTTAYKIVHE
ncbi:MAG: N-acetylmuramoyl-L-alanine amidase [Phaeodactylibacter sp.]|nr:N-acetylmuramoyl-L-alanine amidase [Phaeodactylibacter sp.]